MRPLRLAIVGSRNWPDPAVVRSFVASLHWDTVIITGGAIGVDTYAEEAARARRMSRVIYEPHCAPDATRDAYVSAIWSRNLRIVLDCDKLVAFHTGTNGTQGTIDLARQHDKPVEIRRPA